MQTWDIMTPRSVIFALPKAMVLKEFVKIIEEKFFNRIPVFKSNRDEITGFVIRGEVLLARLKDTCGTATLSDVKRPIAVAVEHTPVDVLFQRFISARMQIILVDEFGGTVGIVSFEDIIETNFGFEIMDEKDKVADMQLHARNLWNARARWASSFKARNLRRRKSKPTEFHQAFQMPNRTGIAMSAGKGGAEKKREKCAMHGANLSIAKPALGV